MTESCNVILDALDDPSRALELAEWVTEAHDACTPDPPRRHQRHEDAPETTVYVAPAPYSGMGSGVEKWRDLVEAYFGDETDLALCVMAGESGGNPNAYNPSGASGLMQIMPFWADEYDLERSDLFIPEVNLWLAKQIRDSSGWGAWNAYGNCV